MSVVMNRFSIEKGKEYMVQKNEMQTFAQSFLTFVKKEFGEQILKRAVFVSLSGNLGAGKTTFTQCVAKELGVLETVNSPTFVIQKSYQTKDQFVSQLVHIDTYRLEEEKEFSVLGFGKIKNTPGVLVLLEWPEKVPETSSFADIKLVFTVDTENTRKISVL